MIIGFIFPKLWVIVVRLKQLGKYGVASFFEKIHFPLHSGCSDPKIMACVASAKKGCITKQWTEQCVDLIFDNGNSLFF